MISSRGLDAQLDRGDIENGWQPTVELGRFLP
jgi:hypothetical protein